MSERKYDPFKDPRNYLRGMSREELDEWRSWVESWKSNERRKATEQRRKARNARISR